MDPSHGRKPVSVTRRVFCSRALAGVAIGTMGIWVRTHGQGNGAGPSGGFLPDELKAMDQLPVALMEKFHVPGLSIAIARQGRLVYVRGFGFADKAAEEKVSPKHLFRIASCSKPITAVTIFRLIEAGKLRLSDKVFGPGAVLGTEYGVPPYKPHIEEITIEHLLTHTEGGWQNDGNDPMFQHPAMNHKELITWTIAHEPLAGSPGQGFAYSNFGYCILGRVIEKITGKPYSDAVQELVLIPCGISGMRISGNTREERAPREATYYSQQDGDPYGLNIRRLDAHGGWLATATDLVRFLVHVDGFPTCPDILASGTVKEMTTAPDCSPNYAKGWCVKEAGNWWHTGSLPGTTAIMVRTAHQFCWAALANTRGGDLGGELDKLMWEMIGKITVWPVGRDW